MDVFRVNFNFFKAKATALSRFLNDYENCITYNRNSGEAFMDVESEMSAEELEEKARELGYNDYLLIEAW